MLLLIDYEIQFIRNERHLALIVLHIIVLHFLEKLLHSRLAEELDERLILRIAFVSPVKQNASVLFVALGDEFPGIIKKGCDKCLLA